MESLNCIILHRRSIAHGRRSLEVLLKFQLASRWDAHPIWSVVKGVVKDDLFEMICAVDEMIIKQVLREEKRAELQRQLGGLPGTVGVVMGMNETQVEELPAMMEEVLREAIDPNVPEFVKKMKRAQERYSLLE
mgnify:CR=1 FL=1